MKLIEKRIRQRLMQLKEQNRTASQKLEKMKERRRALRSAKNKERDHLRDYWSAKPRSKARRDAGEKWQDARASSDNLKWLPSMRDTEREMEWRDREYQALAEMLSFRAGKIPALTDESREIAIDSIHEAVDRARADAGMAKMSARLNRALFGEEAERAANRRSTAKRKELEQLEVEAAELIDELERDER